MDGPAIHPYRLLVGRFCRNRLNLSSATPCVRSSHSPPKNPQLIKYKETQ